MRQVTWLVLILVLGCLPGTLQADDSVRVEVLRCELILARDASMSPQIVYKTEHVDVRMNTILRFGETAPIEIATSLDDTSFVDIWLVFYREPEGVRVRWWTGIGDEAFEFPAYFESGDWDSLEEGGPAVASAPSDVLRRLNYFGPVHDEMDAIKRFVMGGPMELEISHGVRARSTRSAPFRPRFVFREGRVSVEGLLATTEVHVESDDDF